MTDPNEGLSLPEARLQREGDELIRQLGGKETKLSPVLGPDGKPLEGVQMAEGPMPEEAKERARTELKSQVNKQMGELRAASRKEQDEALEIAKTVLDDNPLTLKCSQAMLTLHRVLAWTKLELQMSDERVSDLVLTHMERQVQAAVYHGEGFFSEKLAANLEDTVIALMNKRNDVYDRAIKRRKNLIKAVISQYERHGKTLTLPAEGMYDGFESNKRRVMLGNIVLFTGTPEAIRIALYLAAEVHRLHDQGLTHFFAVEAHDKDLCDAAKGTVYVAQAWWIDGLKTIGKMYKTFKTVADSKASAVAIEDFNLLLRVPVDVMAPSERVSRTFSALQQWAVESAVLVFVGAPSINEPPKYGGLPQFHVTIEDSPHGPVLCLAGEKFPIKPELIPRKEEKSQ